MSYRISVLYKYKSVVTCNQVVLKDLQWDGYDGRIFYGHKHMR